MEYTNNSDHSKYCCILSLIKSINTFIVKLFDLKKLFSRPNDCLHYTLSSNVNSCSAWEVVWRNRSNPRVRQDDSCDNTLVILNDLTMVPCMYVLLLYYTYSLCLHALILCFPLLPFWNISCSTFLINLSRLMLFYMHRTGREYKPRFMFPFSQV